MIGVFTNMITIIILLRESYGQMTDQCSRWIFPVAYTVRKGPENLRINLDLLRLQRASGFMLCNILI